jgi:ribonuclease PH
MYLEDSTAEVDLNVVATGGGGIIEIQGTAEGEPVPRKTIDAMVDLALVGVSSLHKVQLDTLRAAGVDLEALSVR